LPDLQHGPGTCFLDNYDVFKGSLASREVFNGIIVEYLSHILSIQSSREPSQVFVLLQSVYQGFDIIARRRRVFKVETIGDSYVAVTGKLSRK
jgi:Adenylate and Guanylate cyclase catalytic domain